MKRSKRSKGNLLTHTQARRRHCKARALSRYDQELNRFDLREMALKVHKGEGLFVRFTEQGNRRYVECLVDHNQELFRVIFDRKKKELVTLLPIAFLPAEESEATFQPEEAPRLEAASL